MRSALKALPCVEPDSVQVDIKTKQAVFQAKKDAKVDIEEVKNAIAKSGKYHVSAVTEPKTVTK